MIPQTNLSPNYSISKIIKGGWQLSKDHSDKIIPEKAIEDMFAFVEDGVTTFDCADIYTNVEEMIGLFLSRYRTKFSKSEEEKLKIHTKFVPDISSLSSLSKADTETIIDRSLKRLGRDYLNIVQFHWWDYDVPRYIEIANYLKEFQKKGKIQNIGVTNFDVEHLDDLIQSGVNIFSNQIQYSILDHRPQKGMIEYCKKNNINIFCYGTIAGGFLSDRYLGTIEPAEPLENRSLVKYKLIIDDIGGWDLFQYVLSELKKIANKYNVSIANVATKYVLRQNGISAIIVGARNTSHIQDNEKIFKFEFDNVDNESLSNLFGKINKLPGDIYSVERIKGGKHAGIMKYNLNKN